MYNNSSGAPVQMLYAGIFSDERILQLLFIMRTLSDNCFSKLHEVSNEGRPGSTEYMSRFRKGLESIEYWKSDVKGEETRLAVQQYPELGTLYKYAIVRYLKELYKNERTERIPVSIPPLHDFIHSYYIALSKTSYMQKLEFLNVYGLERTHMHMEALRTILMDFTRHSVYRTPVSSTFMGENLTSHMHAPGGPIIQGLVSVERDVTQWDSVSQRGDRPYHDETYVNPNNNTHRQSLPLSPTPNRQVSVKQQNQSNVDRKTRPATIYDKATENYYHKEKEERQKSPPLSPVPVSTPTSMPVPVLTPTSMPVPVSTPTSMPAQSKYANIEIVKEEPDPDSQSSASSSSFSESSDDDVKFDELPVFANDRKKRGDTSSKTSISKTSSKPSASSSHTIHLVVPERSIPNPPTPIGTGASTNRHRSKKPHFF